jgi:hypothetical protein
MVLIMRFILALILALWINPAFAQWGGGGGATINNTVTGAQRVLCSIRAANMNITTDQLCTIPAAVTAWAPTSLSVTNCTATPTLAVGGFYPTASKGGTPMVAAAQAYSTLTTSALVLAPALASGIATNRYTINSTYFSLATAAGGASLCDVYLIGTDLT